MALRTIGSTLQAKASPGSRTREQEEFTRSKPTIPGKGAAGTVSRGLIEEPLERQVSPGSAKIVSAQPTIEGSTVQPMMPPAPLTEGVGLPTTPQPIRSGAAGQALFQGGAAPTPQAQAVSGGAVAGARPAVGNAPTPGAPVPIQGEAPTQPGGGIAPTTGGGLTTKAIAGEGGEQGGGVPSFMRSGLRSLAGAASNVLGSVRGLPELGASERLGSIARNPAASDILGNLVRTIASFTPPAMAVRGQQIGQNLRSNAQSAAQKATSFLRSLFGR